MPGVLGENIEIRVDLGQNLGRVKADFGQIEQVLFNLAINARDAMPLGGKLSIETRLSDARDNGFRGHSTNPPSAYILLTVSDTGQGISGKDLPRIFEPFYTTKPAGFGTGLGIGDGLRHRPAERRLYFSLQRAWQGQCIQDLSPGGRPAGALGRRS